MRIVLAVAVAVMLSLGFARAADAPAIPEQAKVKILKVQLEQANLRAEYTAAQQRMKEIEAQFPKTQQDLQAAVDEAFKEAKLDKKDWNVDLAKLEFVAIPKPVTPEKKP